MKRIGVLLVVLVGLAWIGSKVAPGGRPAVAAAPKAAAGSSPSQIEATAMMDSEPEHRMTPAEKKAQQEKWFGAEMIVSAERAVRGKLKVPNAAQFRDVRANYTEEFGVVACGRVNAKNEFGGTQASGALYSGMDE